jgi:23S rRNA-/tRNA-specific pseudouridylate synthase
MNKNFKKKYYALLIGVLDKEIIEIESKIEKDTKHQKMIVMKKMEEKHILR